MKKITLALVCTSLLSPFAVFAEGSSYITGNVQYHDRKDFNGTDVTSTLEAGHTFASGTTLLVEVDAIQLGNTNYGTSGEQGSSYDSPYTTLGIEQSFNLTDNLWVAAGYHHLLHNGGVFQYRPLVKIGYNFDNGLSISNRTRFHIAGDDKAGINPNQKEGTRFDNAIAYSFADMPLSVKYNNVFYINKNDVNGENMLENSMEHEFRATWTRKGVQPYVEYRNQAPSGKLDTSHNNNVLVIGATYGF
jgi:hypothetical protein